MISLRLSVAAVVAAVTAVVAAVTAVVAAVFTSVASTVHPMCDDNGTADRSNGPAPASGCKWHLRLLL